MTLLEAKSWRGDQWQVVQHTALGISLFVCSTLYPAPTRVSILHPLLLLYPPSHRLGSLTHVCMYLSMHPPALYPPIHHPPSCFVQTSVQPSGQPLSLNHTCMSTDTPLYPASANPPASHPCVLHAPSHPPNQVLSPSSLLHPEITRARTCNNS